MANQKRKARQSRAAQSAANQVINNVIKQLEAALKEKDLELYEVKKELRETRRKLQSVYQETKRTKTTFESFKVSAQREINIAKVRIKVLKKEVKKLKFASGSFNAFGEQKGWRASAIAAGNRLEKKHPGIYQAIMQVEQKGRDPLKFLFDYYGIRTHNEALYDGDDEYTDEGDYQNILFALRELGIEFDGNMASDFFDKMER